VTTRRTIAIVGAGLAEAKPAEAARTAGRAGPVVLIGDESASRARRRRHPRLRLNARNQGTTAGCNTAGQHDIYDRLSFFSDQYDLSLEYVGHATPDDELIVRGDLRAREFIAVWHRDAIVTAAMKVNVWDGADHFKAIVGVRRTVDLARLGNPAVALADLGA
jgi:3-phenylpropionate/trans-cinnamate dioxygenase ferredoxin reductase component